MASLGLNRNELAGNQVSTERAIHDLNEDSRLSFPEDTFDVILNTVSVDYMPRPFEVFREAARILRPGELFLVISSNRMFPEKAVPIWKQSSEQKRMIMFEDFFGASGAFETAQLFISLGRPRPGRDKYSPLGLPSDPMYAVHVEKPGGKPGRKPRQLPQPTREATWNDEQVQRKKS